MHELYRKWHEELEDFRWELTGDPVELSATCIAAPVRAVGRGRASGADIDWPLWQIFELRDGKVCWTAYAADLDSARARVAERGIPSSPS